MKLHIMAQDYTDQLETAMVRNMKIFFLLLTRDNQNEGGIYGNNASHTR
jgi:hypothetical protein